MKQGDTGFEVALETPRKTDDSEKCAHFATRAVSPVVEGILDWLVSPAQGVTP